MHLFFYVLKYVSYTSEVYFYAALYNKGGIPNVDELTFISIFAWMAVFALCALSNVSHENWHLAKYMITGDTQAWDGISLWHKIFCFWCQGVPSHHKRFAPPTASRPRSPWARDSVINTCGTYAVGPVKCNLFRVTNCADLYCRETIRISIVYISFIDDW